MNKVEVLELLRNLVNQSGKEIETVESSYGENITTYTEVVDAEALISAIDHELSKERDEP